MAKGPRAARTNPLDPARQQALRQLLEESEADAALLAVSSVASSARGVRRPFSLITCYPPAERRALLTTRWVRRAVNRALETGRTAVAVGAWHAAPDRPKRSRLLVVAPVINDDGAPRSALAALLPTAEADLEVIALLERTARETMGALMRTGLAVAPAPPAEASLPQLPAPGARFLQHELRAPLGAAAYALEALVMRHAARWEGEDERLIRTARVGLMEAQGILRSANPSWAPGQGPAPPGLRAVSVETVIERAWELFPAARWRVRLDLADDLPAARADELRLTEALTNLLENALKYSWPGAPITVLARPHSPDRVLIAVRSFGEGFPDDQRQIVERGAQDVPPTGPASGGLGLRIVRHFITGMGGDIWIERGEHGSTEVKLTLPIAFT